MGDDVDGRARAADIPVLGLFLAMIGVEGLMLLSVLIWL